MSSGQIILSLLAVVLVIAGTYYATYFLAKTAKRVKSGGMIKLLESFSLSKDKNICLVEVKNKVYLVAMVGNSSTLLDEFDIAEFEMAKDTKKSKTLSFKYEPQGMVQKGLWSAFAAVKTSMNKKSEGSNTSVGRQDAIEEDKLDIVYNRIQNRITTSDLVEQEQDEEKSK